ncbi:calmin [Nematolebias whitei]|uniref:calmin n=1 Tax=Nematolebias whitei TaxID=451745 RepID=UPI0018987FEA|nr:calmin [Nematolebias whitei]
MAGHGWEDWFEREEFIGQISDIRVQNLQVEREGVQKRTFTRWMNLHLEKCDPPLQVQDLFQDIQDGHILMALLEELSGCRLLHSFKKSSHRIFRLNNIAKVLSFLEERNVKLVSIDAADIADGNSSIILGLIWNIILFFQIKELTGNIRSQFPSMSSLSSIPTSSDSDTSFSSTPSDEKVSVATTMRENSKAIKKLLQWVQRKTRKYGVAVQDFGKSWTSGLAFLAVIKSIDSSLVDMRKALLRSPSENLEDAFRIAHYSLGIPRLLEPEDVTINTPDEQSIIMYVSQFLEHFPGIQENEECSQLIERSVSMGRLNFRDCELDQLRNGAHLSRVRQCSSIFERCSTKPPPKVLISSVSEDRSVLTPCLKVAAARSWSSEDILTDSSHVEDIFSRGNVNPRDQSSNVLKDPACDSPHQPYIHSPSSVPESLIGDSAINSPDSWVENELMPERFSESHSDSSLWDSGNTWDVYRATPVDVTPVDEGFMSSMEDRAPDEQSMTESCIDEGVSSMDSNQERIHRQADKIQEKEVKENQEDLENHNQDLITDMTPHVREPDITKHSKQNPSDTLYETKVPRSSGVEYPLEADHLNQFEPSTETQSNNETTSGQRPLEKQEEYQDTKINGKTDFRFTPEVKAESQETDFPEHKRVDSRNETESLHERTDIPVEIQNEELLKVYQHCEESSSLEALEETDSTNNKGTSEISLNVPLISITSEPEEQEEESDPGEQSLQGNSELQSPHSQDGLNHDQSEDNVQVSAECHIENVLLDNGLEDSDGTYSVGNNEIKQEGRGPGDGPQEERDVTVQGSSSNSENQLVNPDNTDLSYGHQDKPTDAFPETGTECTQENIWDPITFQENIWDPVTFQEDIWDPEYTQNDIIDPVNIQENILDLENTQENILDIEYTQENILDPITVQENIVDLKNTQENLLGSTDFQENILDLVDTQQNIVDSGSSKLTGQTERPCPESVGVSRTTNQFYSNLDRSSPTEDLVGELLEPMDLFYPDKEDLMLPEPHDAEMQRWPSVLSVSALQPAPASDGPEDQQLELLGEDFMRAEEEEKNVTNQSIQNPADQSSSQDQCVLCGVAIRPHDPDAPADGGGNTEFLRTDAGSPNRPHEVHIPPVLRHRKGSRLSDSSDKRRAALRSAENQDADTWCRENCELCVLLLLWLLLYSFMLLKQMDLKMLPGLLLNLQP